MKQRLTTDDLMTFFSVFECCGMKHLVGKEMLMEHNEIVCMECDEPAMFKGTNGLWYAVKGRIFP